MTEKNKFYNTKAWKRAREAYKKQCGGLCEECLKKGIIRAGEMVHHIKPVTKQNVTNPEITLNPQNFMLLCRDCHAEKHKKEKGERRYWIDEDGKVLTRPPVCKV